MLKPPIGFVLHFLDFFTRRPGWLYSAKCLGDVTTGDYSDGSTSNEV